jgi:hypothetical protein
MVANSIITAFIQAIGGPEAYYGIFAMVFVISTAAVFYKIST